MSHKSPLDEVEVLLIAELEDLPEDLPVPDGLDAAVLADAAAPTTPPREEHPPRWRSTLPWVLLAASLLLWSLSRPPGPTVVHLTSGTEIVDGQGTVHIGVMRVSVEGHAQVTVEPPPPVSRGDEAEEVGMDTQRLRAGLVGAVVTVAVMEGRALVYASDGAVTVVEAGTQHQVTHPGARPARVHRPSPDAAHAERIAALEAELAEAQLEVEMYRAQLVHITGEPVPWTPEIPDAYREDGIADLLEEVLAESPDASLVALDCEEYPCIAVVRHVKSDEAWEDLLSRDLPGLGFEDGILSFAKSERGGTIRGEKAYLRAVVVTQGRGSTALSKRVRHRADVLVSDLSDTLKTTSTGG